MNNFLKLDLFNNPVKQDKIKRVYQKMNKIYSLLFNIENNKIDIPEITFIINEIGKMNSTIDQEKSIFYTNKYNKKIFYIKDSSPIFLILNYTENISFDAIKDQVQFENIKILDMTGSMINREKDVIHYQVILDNIHNYIKNDHGYKQFVNTTSSYFNYNHSKKYSMEAITEIQMQLNWTAEQVKKFIKESKIQPGDIIPSAKNINIIMDQIDHILKYQLNSNEKAFLKTQVEMLYLDINGRFPNIDDLIMVIQNSFLKMKENYIESLYQYKQNGDTVTNIPECQLSELKHQLNHFLNYKDIINEPYFRIPLGYWTYALKMNKLNELYKILIDLKNQGYNVVFYGFHEDSKTPNIKVFHNFENKFNNMDFAIFNQSKD